MQAALWNTHLLIREVGHDIGHICVITELDPACTVVIALLQRVAEGEVNETGNFAD